MNPASAAPRAPSVASMSNGPAFRNVCSLSMTRSTAAANPAPWAKVNSGSLAAGSSRAAASSWAASGSSPRPPDGRRRQRSRRASAGGTTASDTIGAAAMPSATAVCPSGDSDGHGQREQAARARLHQHQPAVEPEVTMAGEEPAREVAGRVGEHRDDQDPVQARRAAEEVVLQRPAQHERGRREQKPEGELDRRGHAQVLGAADPAGVVVGDRARQELLHRPVEHGHRDEDRRPQAARCGRTRRPSASG